jgi:hypothetical protein
MHLNTPYNNCRDNGLGRGDGASDVLYICHKIAISGHTGLCVNEHKTQSTHQSAGNTAFDCPGKPTAPGAASLYFGCRRGAGVPAAPTRRRNKPAIRGGFDTPQSYVRQRTDRPQQAAYSRLQRRDKRPLAARPAAPPSTTGAYL